MHEVSCSGYPRVIEPCQADLIADLVEEGHPSRCFFSRLSRAGMPPILLAELADCHCFATTGHITNQLFLAYGPTGRFRAVYVYREQAWQCCVLPEELTGDIPKYPSVRLVFKTPRTLQAFLQYLRMVESGKMPNPALGVLLADLHEPPRIIEVCNDV